MLAPMNDEGDAQLPVVAGVELGGTKALAVLARGDTVLERVRIPTTDPTSTLAALSDQLVSWETQHGGFAAIGIGGFGPLGLDPHRQDFGWVTTTPKPGWANVDVRGHFARRFGVPIGFDTDVAGAALAEGRWGTSQGCPVHLYITIGTGIGAGVVVDGRPVHGLVHPEIGHIRVRRATNSFPGTCPFHGDCIEGLTSGPAIAARAGVPAEELGVDDPVWHDVAADVAELMAVLILVLSPQRIVLGGGVGNGSGFPLAQIRANTIAVLSDYVAAIDEAEVERLIQQTTLGDDSGPLGATALALLALGLL